jgi:hypothetical protein
MYRISGETGTCSRANGRQGVVQLELEALIRSQLGASDQIIHQDTFTVAPGTSLEQIVRIGETDHEPTCLVEGLRRVVEKEVALHFHRVVALRT